MDQTLTAQAEAWADQRIRTEAGQKMDACRTPADFDALTDYLELKRRVLIRQFLDEHGGTEEKETPGY